MAARTKYCDEVVTRITDAVKAGAHYETAAAYGGVSYETFRVWRERKPAFSAALKKAEGEMAVRQLARIQQAAATGVWQASAWLLERRFPEQYGRQIHEVGGSAERPFRIIIERVDRASRPAERTLAVLRAETIEEVG